jgi:molybdopterin molybdotransferase
MLELEQAVERILGLTPKPEPERIALDASAGRILLEPAVAAVDLPVFDNSSVDGYAVRVADIAAATQKSPVALELVGRVAAGEPASVALERTGQCVRILTGAPMPVGAEAVVMQEDTAAEGARVSVLDAVVAGENIRKRGEDVRRGSILIKAGERLTAFRIGLLAASGVAEVVLGRCPVVGLLATGSELKSPGEALGPGQIFESNRAALTPLIRSVGGIPRVYPMIPDELEATRRALSLAFAECDVVVTCGGVSVGETDYVKAAFEDLGGKLQFWKVAIKPGKPFVFGQFGTRHLFGLPGNPVSALVTFLLLVRPALLRRQGGRDVELPVSMGVLGESLVNSGARRHFMRVSVDPAGIVRSAGVQGAHILKSLASADGMVNVPAEATLPQGTSVRVLRFE